MESFNTQDLGQEILALRSKGLTDNLIVEELKKQGHNAHEIEQHIAHLDAQAAPHQFSGGMPSSSFPSGDQMQGGMAHADLPALEPAASFPSASPALGAGEQHAMYERVEEIAESIIDEKWEELLSEVRKIIEWKDKVEHEQVRLRSELEHLKEEFSVLHQGVLGKLDRYDERMGHVSTELDAVGKVFKDVVPTFVENVKDLNDLATRLKK